MTIKNNPTTTTITHTGTAPYCNVNITGIADIIDSRDSAEKEIVAFAGIGRRPDPFDVFESVDKINSRLQKIEESLGIIVRNEYLENKYAELKKLGDSYTVLEKELKEKDRMWNLLKK